MVYWMNRAVLCWLIAVSVIGISCLGAAAEQADEVPVEGVWRTEFRGTKGHYKNGWALAQFDQDNRFSMVILHQRDKDAVEKLHYFSGRWRQSEKGARVESLSLVVGTDRLRIGAWTFGSAGDALTDDRYGLHWQRVAATRSISATTVTGRWISDDDASGPRYSLLLHANGQADLFGERIQLDFQRGGASVLARNDQGGVSFRLTGRWQIISDMAVLYGTSYTASHLGEGQFAPSIVIRAGPRESLQMKMAGQAPLVFRRDHRGSTEIQAPGGRRP